MRNPRERDLAVRLFTAQALVVAAGAATFVAVSLVIAPEVFDGHVREAFGTLDDPVARHLEEGLSEALLISMGLGVVAALLAALALSWFAARRITRPVADLAAAAAQVAGGQTGVRVPESRLGRELTALTRAFNEMATTLERTDRVRRDLLDDLAHELRTPLATVEGYLEGVADGVVPADAETWRLMRGQTARMRRLVDDLGTVARAEHGRLDLQPVPKQAADLARDVTEAVAPAFRRKGVALRLRTENDLPVLVDVDRMHEVLGNLLDNALRHTPAGGVVEVAAASEPPGVAITVVDTGDGIPTEDLPRVFERFHRADRSRSRARGGSGLGLAIVRALVEAHGGQVRAESSGPGTGARFTVMLPAASVGRSSAAGRG